jgi:serine/threonine-protein kinase
MPFVDGESLRLRLHRGRPLPVDEAVRIARDVARALDYAHGQGLIHRDIKPENILLTRQGDALVADFGIGRALGGRAEDERRGRAEDEPRSGTEGLLTGVGALVGTPAYMSLEQADGERELDGRADVYSLGVVLYEMLAGVRPFAGSSAPAIVAKQLTEIPPPLRPGREEISPELEAVVLRMLARDADDRYPTAGAVADALEEVHRTGTAATAMPSAPSRTRWLAGVLAALAAAALAAGVLRWRGTAPLELRESVVAIAPFDVLDPDLVLWREGLVDLLSRNLDGAGPLRSVPPTVVVRRWAGRADAPSAATLGRRTGAELALFGSLLRSGPDSARLRATLLDVARGQTLGEWEVVDAVDRMDRLVDSLTLRLVNGLGRTRPIGAVRLAGFRGAGLPVLKAFLQGEQHYRRSAWDSALAHYLHAIELDGGFTPALGRAGKARYWISGFDSLARAYIFRAGANNHGLPPRDSLLVAAESLFADVMNAGPLAIRADSGWTSRLHRLFATLTRATTRYPDDPEAWFLLGDAQSHLGAFAGRSWEQQLQAYDRAIALDSAFAPAYLHAIWTSGRYGPDAMRRYLRPYLALAPYGAWGEGARLIQRVLDSPAAMAAPTAIFDSVSDEALVLAFQYLGQLPDSVEVAVHLGRFLAVRQRSVPPPFDDTLFVRMQVARTLLSRGHLRASREFLPGHSGSLFFPEAVLLGAVPAESAAMAFRDRLAGPVSHRLVGAFPWWASQKDTTSLRQAEVHADSLALRDPDPVGRARARYATAAASAYLLLARQDTAAALERLLALAERDCPPCYLDRFTLAQLLVDGRRDPEAWRILQGEHRFSTLDPTPTEVLWALLRGRVAERLDERERAIQSYAWVVGMWRNADPELQHYVREAREGLERLTGEEGR